jgi:uncharacterized membrane protein YphA (DoxX/SURF4 family)
VGWVFVSEGIQKFLFPAELGFGRFTKIGIPDPHLSAPFVGAVEIVCGLMVIAGLLTSFAIVPLLIVIATAIATTKIPFVIQHGVWAALHEARTDLSMLFGLISIGLLGAGDFSLDARRRRGRGFMSG